MTVAISNVKVAHNKRLPRCHPQVATITRLSLVDWTCLARRKWTRYSGRSDSAVTVTTSFDRLYSQLIVQSATDAWRFTL